MSPFYSVYKQIITFDGTSVVQKKVLGESVRQPLDHPNRSRNQLRTILYGRGRPKQDQPGAVNHALVKRSRFIHQTWEPVSLEVKDTEVRAYRTDPVQVRSCFFVSTSSLYTCHCLQHASMWDSVVCLWPSPLFNA